MVTQRVSEGSVVTRRVSEGGVGCCFVLADASGSQKNHNLVGLPNKNHFVALVAMNKLISELNLSLIHI